MHRAKCYLFGNIYFKVEPKGLFKNFFFHLVLSLFFFRDFLALGKVGKEKRNGYHFFPPLFLFSFFFVLRLLLFCCYDFFPPMSLLFFLPLELLFSAETLRREKPRNLFTLVLLFFLQSFKLGLLIIPAGIK